MRPLFLFCLLLSLTRADAQRLRDSLFAGKLKVDTGKTFVSKDTAKYVALKNDANVFRQTEKKTITVPSTPASQKPEKAADPKPEVSAAPVMESTAPDLSMPDSLNKQFYARQKQWKRFIDTNVPLLTQQANDSRKVKKGSYEVTIAYEIGLNGRVTTKSVTSVPANEFLVEQVTELMKRSPVLSPPVYSDGKPRALPASQTITIVKK